MSFARNALVSAIVCVSMAAQCAVAAPLDRRKQSDADRGTRRVLFCARPSDASGGGPGHAFVVFEHSDRAGKRVEFLAVGHGPVGSKISPLPAAGQIFPENFSHAGQECVTVLVEKYTYDAIRKQVQQEREFDFAGIKIPVRRNYYLLANDCVTFMSGMARYVGLAVPDRTAGLTPMAYVRALAAANRS